MALGMNFRLRQRALLGPVVSTPIEQRKHGDHRIGLEVVFV